MKTLRLIFYIMVWMLALWRAAMMCKGAETGYHDPALDGINNNLAIMDADINGGIQDLPAWVAKTNWYVHTNMYQGVIQTNTKAKVTAAGITFINSVTFDDGTLGALGEARGLSNAMRFQSSANFKNFTNAEGSSDFMTITNANEELLQFDFNAPDTVVGTLGHHFHWRWGWGSWEENFHQAEIGGAVRVAIMAGEGICIMILLMVGLRTEMSETLNQRQVVGSSQSVVGTNASSVVGLSYATVITVGLLSVCVVLFTVGGIMGGGSMVTLLAFKMNLKPLLDGMTAWGIIAQWIPLWETLLMWVGYFGCRYIIMGPAFMMVRAVILYLVA